jgi:hypothetical protein
MSEENDDMTTVRSATMADGSFGFRAAANGGVMTLWYCGVWLVHGQVVASSPGYHGNTSGPCVHRTRAAAKRCPNPSRIGMEAVG